MPLDALLLGKTESKKWMILPSEKNAHDKWTEKDQVILLQFTGLKDKNGKEIYEGDLIGDKDCYVEVIFKDGSFCNKGDFKPIIEWIWARKRKGIETEVIGNIYENPELLT